MKKNDIFELEITDMGTDGEGIGHYDGMTFFVKDALIGDVITARATKLKKNYGYARVEEIKTPSTFRVEPQCELHKRCGGCQIQALSYEKQLEFKNNKVRNNLMRIGGFSEAKLDSKMQPPVGADNPYRYRNKAQFPVGYDRDGMTFFVKDALIGDVITARATKLKKNYGYARVEEIKTPSTFRVEPQCELHKRCGGCQIQALSYEKQLEFKNNKVRNNLMRIGGFSEAKLDSKMQPPVGADNPYRYRNKAQFPVGYDRDGNIVTGFYASRSHNIIPVEDCRLGVPQNKEILDIIKEWMNECGITPYDENTHKGLVRHVLIRYGFTSKQIMVCLVINADELELEHLAADILCERLSKIDGMTSISYNINKENTNVILGKKTVCIWGRPYIEDTIHLLSYPDFTPQGTGITYQISPQSFYQVNPKQTEKLYSTALAFAGLTGNENVWDLYCGIGTISLFLSQKAKQVYGVEIVPQAIEDAKNNAKLNGITNAQFFVGKAEEVLPQFYENAKKTEKITDDKASTGRTDMLRPDVIVVDPPRKGCDEKCLDTMLAMSPERIVYVSCDSATLARDLKILCEEKYELIKWQTFDQFSHTTHVESICLLERVSN